MANAPIQPSGGGGAGGMFGALQAILQYVTNVFTGAAETLKSSPIAMDESVEVNASDSASVNGEDGAQWSYQGPLVAMTGSGGAKFQGQRNATFAYKGHGYDKGKSKPQANLPAGKKSP